MYEVVLRWEDDTSEYLNVLHYDLAGPNFDDFQALADQISIITVGPFTDLISTSVRLVGITVREDVPGAVGVPYNFSAGPVAGTASDDDYASVLAMQVDKFCGNTLRPNRGWLFLPGISSDYLRSDSRWEAGARTLAFDWMTAMIDFAYNGTATAQMLLKASNPSAPNTVAYNTVSAAGTSGIPKTVRSRIHGRGS